ncbi:hypothetical protein ALC57_11714 [Trachymyrmex cornetzi]|uniref:Uncharacterized protein n=1 Tax=Trachymyrmex cornetzi TaxID=471704 RepID=A0A151J241_9HYME|nr:hypothetical protein ALC57_11714 [Trachymyrmex cornetzi]
MNTFNKDTTHVIVQFIFKKNNDDGESIELVPRSWLKFTDKWMCYFPTTARGNIHIKRFMNILTRQMIRADRRAEREFRAEYMDIWDDRDLFLNELFSVRTYESTVAEDMWESKYRLPSIYQKAKVGADGIPGNTACNE